MSDIQKVYDFLNDAETYYLATVDGDQPRVRPFGTVFCQMARSIFRQESQKMFLSSLQPILRLRSVHSRTESGSVWQASLLTTILVTLRLQCLRKCLSLAECTAQMMIICRCCISRMQQQLSALLQPLPRQSSSDDGFIG